MEKITKSSKSILIDPNEPLILPNGTALVGRIEWFLYALCCLDYQNLPTPMSRIEEFANALITGEVPNIEPQSRAEQFFLAILDGNVSNLPQPQSRSEVLLDKLARGEFDLSDVEPIQSHYELLLAYLIKNGGIGNIDYVLYEFSEKMKTMYNTIEKPFKSLELSGNTLVNCVLEDTENDDYTSFDKDYSGTSFTINGTSEGAIKSAILSGQTLVNLVRNGNSFLTLSSSLQMFTLNLSYNLEKNKKYLIVGETTQNEAAVQGVCLMIKRKALGNKYIAKLQMGVGIFSYIITPDDEITGLSFYIHSDDRDNGKTLTVGKAMVLEYQDGMENWNIPYFEGMQSVKMPVLKTIGKNLFDGELVKNKYYNGSTGELVAGNNNLASVNPIRVNPNASIVLSTSANLANNNHYICEYASDGTFIKRTNSSKITTSETTYFIKFHFAYADTNESPNVQLEEGSVATPYEPHKSNILTTTSKNLFDMNRPYDAITDSQATVVQDTNKITVSSAESGIYVNANFILDKDFFAGKTVTGSCLYESDEKDIGTVQIHYQDGNGEHHYQWIRTPKTFTFPNSFIGDVMLSVSANNTGTPQSNTVTVKNIQLELGSTATSYEPYSEGVTLRGIGDVQDELNCLMGELTQNIYQITLTGDESGYGYSTAPSVDTDFHGTLNIGSANLPLNKKLVAPISNRFQGALYGANKTWQCCIGGSYALHFFIPKTELETSDINGFKNWVKQQYLNGNPIKVAYILEEKSIKTVDLNVVDQNNTKIDKMHVFNEVTHVNASSDELTPTVNIGKSVSYPTIIKPNTKYTVDLKRNDKSLTVNLGGTEVTFTSGETRKTITTPSTLVNDKLSYYGIGAKCNEIMLIEGEIERNIDYFTGMQSVAMQNQMPILSTVGKNLFNYKNYNLKVNEEQNPQEIIVDEQGLSFNVDTASWKSLWYDLYLESGEKYTLSYNTNLLRCFISKSKVNTYVSSELVADTTVTNATEDKIQKVTKTFTAPSTGFIRVRLVSEQKVGNHILQNFQIEKSSSVTTYEPHKSSILSCNDDVTLRGIGDIKDELNLLTGELTERIGEIVLDGSENWIKPSNQPTNTVRFLLTDFPNNRDTKIKSNFKVKKNAMNDEIGIWCDANTVLNLDTSVDTVDSLKVFLSKNPIKLQYSLATESVKVVDLDVVDQDGNTIPKIKSYNDVTHLEITVPKQSLLPHISAEVATDNSKDMSSLTIKHQEISEAQATIEDSIQSQSDEIDTALMATTEIFESILE
jgi:hypothetical protein